jgi:hypothetical protein
VYVRDFYRENFLAAMFARSGDQRKFFLFRSTAPGAIERNPSFRAKDPARVCLTVSAPDVSEAQDVT